MRKVILDFSLTESKEAVQEYIAEEMEFPEYYGKNLDALYDELSSIAVPTAIGFFYPVETGEDLDIDLMMYIDRVKEIFDNAEQDNPNIAVIYGDIVDNFGEDFMDDEDFEAGFQAFLQEIMKEDGEI